MISEDTNKSKGPTTDEVNQIIETNAHVTEVEHLGKIRNDRQKSTTLRTKRTRGLTYHCRTSRDQTKFKEKEFYILSTITRISALKKYMSQKISFFLIIKVSEYKRLERVQTNQKAQRTLK